MQQCAIAAPTTQKSRGSRLARAADGAILWGAGGRERSGGVGNGIACLMRPDDPQGAWSERACVTTRARSSFPDPWESLWLSPFVFVRNALSMRRGLRLKYTLLALSATHWLFRPALAPAARSVSIHFPLWSLYFHVGRACAAAVVGKSSLRLAFATIMGTALCRSCRRGEDRFGGSGPRCSLIEREKAETAKATMLT